MYKVKEIFKSIQGEGFHSGKTAVFIRFSGCNLWNGIEKSRKRALCNFCDTDFVGTNGQNGGKYDLESLVKKIEILKLQTKAEHGLDDACRNPFLGNKNPVNKNQN